MEIAGLDGKYRPLREYAHVVQGEVGTVIGIKA
jgi:hypothetical protein